MTNSRTAKFIRNSMSVTLLQLVTMLAGLITPRIMLSFYGSEINGLVSSITQFITYINLVEAGLSNAAVYALFKPLANDERDEISAVVSAAKKFYMQAGYIFMGFVTLLAIFYPLYIGTSSLPSWEMGILIILVGANGAMEFITLAKYRVLLTADQKTYVVSLSSILRIIINTIIVVLMANLGANIVALKAAALLALVGRSLVLVFYCQKHYGYLNFKSEPNDKALSKRWDALYLQIMGVIHRGAPVILITLILKDLKLVSMYTIFNMVTGSLNSMMSIFKSGLPASFGEVIARGDKKILQKSYGEFEYIYYKLITVIYSTAFVMIMPFVALYTKGITDFNYYVPMVGFLFVLNGLLYNIKTPQGMLVISSGLYKETKLQTAIQGLIVLILGAIFAVPFGIAGILIASILSNLYRAVDLPLFISKNVTMLPVAQTAKRMIILLFSTALIVLLSSFITIQPTGYLMWCMKAVAIVAVAMAVVGGFGLLFERNDLFSITKRLGNVISPTVGCQPPNL